MTELENKFFEAYKQLDLLIKRKLGKENGVSDYIDDMVKRYSAVPANPNYRQILKELKHIRWVRNNIAHSAEDSGCKESDVYVANYYYNQICNDQDPLAKVVVQQVRPQTVNKNFSASKVKEEQIKQKKYDTMKKVFGTLTDLIIALYIVPLLCVFLVSKYNEIEEKKKNRWTGYAGTKYSYFSKEAWPEGSAEAKEVFENIAYYWTRQDLVKYLKPLVNTVTNPGEVTSILEGELNINIDENNINVDELVEELNSQEDK